MARQRLGPAVALLQADDAGFRRGMQQSARELENARKESERLRRRLGEAGGGFSGLARSARSFVGTFAGAFAVGGITSGFSRLVNSAADTATELRASADALGLSISQFTAYERVLLESGAAQQTVTTGLRTLSRAIGEAGDGTAEYADQFERIGVRVRDASGQLRGITDVLPEIADGVRGLAQADRVLVASTLFGGRAGLRFLSILQQGGQQFKELTEEAQRNAAVSEFTTRENEKLSTAINTFATEVRNATLEIGAMLGPSVIEGLRVMGGLVAGAARFMSVFASETQKARREIEESREATVRSINEIDGAVQRQTRIESEIASSQARLLELAQSHVAAILELNRAREEGNRNGVQLNEMFLRVLAERRDAAQAAAMEEEETLRVLQGLLAGVDEQSKQAAGSARAIAESFDASTLRVAETQQAVIELRREEEKRLALQARFAEQQRRETRRVRELQGALSPTQVVSELTRQGTRRLQADLEAGLNRDISLTERRTQAFLSLGRVQADEIKRQQRELSDGFRIQQELAADIGQTLGFGIQQAVLEARSLGDVFRGIARSLAGSLLQNLLIAPLAGGLSSILGRQSGGPVSRNRPYIVGEGGPELFVPRVNGQIIPNGAGGATFVYSPTVNAFGPEIEARMVATNQAMFPQFQRLSEQSIERNSRRRGG